MENTGFGAMHPQDTPEFVEITVTVENGTITSAEYTCYDDELLRQCADTVCEVIKDKPFEDIFQMNNNAVYYNIPGELPRDRLYLASVAVMAAKKAVKDYAVKNGVMPDLPDTGCTCI